MLINPTNSCQGSNPIFNPDILGQIANYLPVEEVNVIREVCPQWKKDWPQIEAKNLNHNENYINYKMDEKKAIDVYNKFYRTVESSKPSFFSFILPVIIITVNALALVIPAVLVYPVAAAYVIAKRILKRNGGGFIAAVKEAMKLTDEILNYTPSKRILSDGLKKFKRLQMERQDVDEVLKKLREKKIKAKNPQDIDYSDLKLSYFSIFLYHFMNT